MQKSTKVMLEVCFLFIVVIGICRGLYHLRHIPFIAQTLPLWAAALFLYLPLSLLYYTRKRPEEWGITFSGLGFSLKVVTIVSLLSLPAFVLLYRLYQHWLLQYHAPTALVFSLDWFFLLTYHFFCVAFPEEVFYRGYMQSRLNEAFPKRINVFSAPLGFSWLLTAVLFALGHYLVLARWNSLATFFPGLVFGWLRERTNSIVASTIFHALCNGTILLLT